jgi:hypothetical protein
MAMENYRAFRTRAVLVIQTLYGELLLIACVLLAGCEKKPVSFSAKASEDSVNSQSMQEHHTIHPGALRIIKEEFGLVNMSIEVPASGVLYQSISFENKVSFEDALRDALRSFMEDDTDLESPLGLIKDDFRSSEEERKVILFDYLNKPSTFLRLVAVEVGYPEHGESIKKNWVFQLVIKSYSDHLYWAIVDRAGKHPVYNFGFN